jgi:mono/diheme cytochrome c family protein
MRAALTVAGASIVLLGCGSAHHASWTVPRSLEPGRQVFLRAGCGGCHTLSVAGTHGTIGPDFDRTETLNASQIRNQLDVGAGGMPSFRDRLTPREKADVAAFLAAAMRHLHAR